MAVKKDATAATEGKKAVEVKDSTYEEEKSGNRANMGGEKPKIVKRVYIGPTLPGAILKTNRVFEGSEEAVKKELESVLKRFPLVERLLVPIEGLAEKKNRGRTAGNILNKYYSDIVSVAAATVGKEG